MASPAQQSSLKFLAIGKINDTELHDTYTPTGEQLDLQLIEECLKILAESDLKAAKSAEVHHFRLKSEEYVMFIKHGNTRLDQLYSQKIREELNMYWNPDVKLSDFMAKMAERPKRITRPPPKGPNKVELPHNQLETAIHTVTTSTELTIVSHKKISNASSSVDQIKLMMAEDQRFSALKAQKAGNQGIQGTSTIKLIINDERSNANTPKTEDVTSQRSSNALNMGEKGTNMPTNVINLENKEKEKALVILGAESASIETKAESSAESAVVAEEMRKIKQASTNKKIFVVVILVLAVIVFALVPVLTK